jgi:hypothetical protein
MCYVLMLVWSTEPAWKKGNWGEERNKLCDLVTQ